MSNGSWDNGIEGPAYDIAATTDTPLLVVAGPGTGKTFALMRRVWRLLQDGMDPTRAFVGTFTRTAATDLKDSLSELGAPGGDQVRAGTIHSYCFGLLAREAVFQHTRRVARLLLKYEERFLLQDLDRGEFGGILERRKRLEAFTGAWARLQSDDPGWPNDPVDQQFHNDLMNWMRFHSAMHIGELVWIAFQYLRDNPASDFRSAFDHVLVDEYQDLNRAEQVLLDLLAEAGSLTVIGDEDQSIYSFRCAHPEGIQQFENDHPGASRLGLTECRRCPRTVVSMANAFIARNQNRAPRALQPRPENAQGEVHIVQWGNMQEEAFGIAAFIANRISEGRINAGDVLVLSPRRQFGYLIRDELVRLSIPACSFFLEEELDGSPAKAEKCGAQEAFTVLKLLADPSDIVALRCWCGFRVNQLRSAAWGRVREFTEQNGVSPLDVLDGLADGSITIPYAGQILAQYNELRDILAQNVALRGEDLIDALFPADADWANGLRSLALNLSEDDCDASELHKLLLTAITQPELPTDVDFVRVMSLHKSKGLTADLVVVAGCIEGLLPFLPKDLPPDEEVRAMEEQRRLFYVALTRARETLVLSSVLQLPRDVAHRMGARIVRGNQQVGRTIASQFLGQLGNDCPRAVPGHKFLNNGVVA